MPAELPPRDGIDQTNASIHTYSFSKTQRDRVVLFQRCCLTLSAVQVKEVVPTSLIKAVGARCRGQPGAEQEKRRIDTTQDLSRSHKIPQDCHWRLSPCPKSMESHMDVRLQFFPVFLNHLLLFSKPFGKSLVNIPLSGGRRRISQILSTFVWIRCICIRSGLCPKVKSRGLV